MILVLTGLWGCDIMALVGKTVSNGFQGGICNRDLGWSRTF